MSTKTSEDSPPTIRSVHVYTRTLLWGTYRNWLIGFSLPFFALLFSPVPIQIVIVLYIATLGIVYGVFYNKALTLFMKEFGERRGMTYQNTIALSEVRGRLFNYGRKKHISNVLSGTFESYPIRLFHYSYTVGSGKNSKTHHFTVFECSFEKTIFPFIYLQSKTMTAWSRRLGARGISQDVEISLESPYEKSFRLFTTLKYEIETLQIFTPEVLLFLIERAHNFSIEFADNRLYIYDDAHISNYDDLKELFDVAHEILARVNPLLDRLHNDFAVLHPYFGEKQ